MINSENLNTTAYAWELARAAAKEYGGSAKDYFGQAMKAAVNEVWENTAAQDIENIMNALDVKLESASYKMQGYIEKAHNVLISLINNAIADAEERGEAHPQTWVRNKLQDHFGDMEAELQELEFAIYHGSGYSKDEGGLPQFIAAIQSLESALQTTADGKWW